MGAVKDSQARSWVSVSVPDDLRACLQRVARENDRSVSETRHALVGYPGTVAGSD